MGGVAYRDVNQSDARAKVGVGVDFVDEGMLAPVANHQAHAELHERQQEHAEGRAPGHISPEEEEGGVVADFPEGGFAGEIGLALAEEVQRQLQPDQEEEATDVAEEVEEVVALIADGRGEVLGAVALDVVVLDVVVIVGVPGVAHERVGDVGEQLVKPAEAFLQDPAHVDMLVHHEGVRAHVVGLHDPVQDTVRPVEVSEQEDCTGDRGCEIQQQVGEHHHVGVNAHDLSC